MSFQVTSKVLNDEEQTKAEMAALGQEMKNLRSELQVNAVEGTTRTVNPNQKQDKRQQDLATFAA